LSITAIDVHGGGITIIPDDDEFFESWVPGHATGFKAFAELAEGFLTGKVMGVGLFGESQFGLLSKQ